MNRYQYSVPLYIYLPPQLRKSVKVNAEVYGSHSDILPTLASLLLSDVRYFALGQNLFDSTITKRGSISINQMQVLHSPQISTKKAELKANARIAISKWLFGKVIDESKRTDIKKHSLN
jgi:membrane-anchored protein YejM (alkaline phosphatase superfamily)